MMKRIGAVKWAVPIHKYVTIYPRRPLGLEGRSSYGAAHIRRSAKELL